MRPSKILLVLAAAAGALVLPGCVAFFGGGPTAKQLRSVGDVAVTASICAADTPDSGQRWTGCDSADTGGSSLGHSGLEGDKGTFQLLTGYRLPDGVTDPLGFSTTEQPGTTRLAFVRNTAYSAELERLLPTPTGFHWVGYRSGTFAHGDGPADHAITIAPAFSLPQGAGGEPFAGPFRYRQVLGFRTVSDQAPAGRVVVCGAKAGDQADDGWCIDAPGTAELTSNESAPTRDLGILAPGTQPSVVAGSSVAVPFEVEFAGAAQLGLSFDLAASTTVPGATATPSQASLRPPGTGTTPVTAIVDVPAAAPAGAYDVTLAASLPNGEVRKGTQTVTVLAAPKPTGQGLQPPAGGDTRAPVVTVKVLKGQTGRSLFKRGLRVRVASDEAGGVTLALKVGKRRLASKPVAFEVAGAKIVRLKLGKAVRKPAARQALLAPERMRLTLRATATDGSGNAGVAKAVSKLKRGE